MNWGAIGAVGEILGAVAVFVTLVYLAKQLRENTASNKVATAWSMMITFNTSHGEIFGSRENAELASRMLTGEELDVVDQMRVNSLVLRHLNGLVAAYEAHQARQLSDLLWDRTRRDAVFLTHGTLRPFLLQHLKLVAEETVVAIFGLAIRDEIRNAPLNPFFTSDD